MSSGRGRHAAAGALSAFLVATALGGCASGAASSPPRTGSHPTTTTTAPATTTTAAEPHTAAAHRMDDGSLGAQATRTACTLLSRAEIERQFGGPVGPATPANPYCMWLVGRSAFLALDYMPNVAFAQASHWTGALVRLSGVGKRAEIGDNRYLYFSDGPSSFWLLYQQVGDFASLHQSQLAALARDVLSRPLPHGSLPAPPPVPSGPPIYFAGDSTAAGPEWAWVTYHSDRASLRTLAEYQVGSGLVVPGYFNWPRHLLAVTAEERPKLVVFMGSANDDQPLPYKGGYAQVGSPAWRQAYASIVASTMGELRREGAKVLWIGEPAMQSASLSAAMLDIDEICHREANQHPGVYWFNPGTVLNLPGWRYTSSLEIGGHEVQVRLDGVHLNTEGSIYLADKLAPLIEKILGV